MNNLVERLRKELESLERQNLDSIGLIHVAEAQSIVKQLESHLAQQGNAGDQEEDSEWRRLALQFDGHRMQAIGHLKAMLSDPAAHSAKASEFLSAGPLSGEEVLKQRIAELATTQANGQGKEAEPADRYCFCLNHACGWSGIKDTAIAHESRGIICPYCKGATQECTPKDQKERALFEAHMRKDGWGGWSLSRSEANGLYADGVVNRFWEVWKARSALSLPVPIAAIQEKP